MGKLLYKWRWVLIQGTLLVLWWTGLVLTGNLIWLGSIVITTLALWAAGYEVGRIGDDTGSWRCFFGHKYGAFRADRIWEPWVIAAGRFVRYEVRCYGCGRKPQ